GVGVRATHGAAARHRRRKPGGRGRSRGDGAGSEGPRWERRIPGRRSDRRGDAGRPGGVRGGAAAARGRRVVTRRGWAALIFVAWAGSLGWLARRELFRSTGARLAEAALSVPPGAVYYRLAVAGQQVGFASSTIDTAGSTIRVEDVLVLDVPALGVLHRTTAQSRATLSRALRLQDLATRFDGDLGRFSSHATVSGDTALALWLVAGPDSEFTRVPLQRPIVLPTLLPLRLAFGGELKPGKTYSMRIFDPLLLSERDVAVTIAPESTLVVADSADYDSTAMAWVPIHFDTVRAFGIEQRRTDGRASAWIDAAGRIVRATSGGDGGGAFTMERSAFEIAYETFRRRDTARVARASASPRAATHASGRRRGRSSVASVTPRTRPSCCCAGSRPTSSRPPPCACPARCRCSHDGAATATSTRCCTSRWPAPWGCRPVPPRDSCWSTAGSTTTLGPRSICGSGCRWTRRSVNSPPTPRACGSASAAWPAR